MECAGLASIVSDFEGGIGGTIMAQPQKAIMPVITKRFKVKNLSVGFMSTSSIMFSETSLKYAKPIVPQTYFMDTIMVKLNTASILLIFAGILIFRLLFGLCGEFWVVDERQIYLLGLKFFTTHLWPFFGPDVVYTQSQIPGALQALLVGLPLFISRVPEAPFVLLNLLTFGALLFFAWYISLRLPGLPRWYIYGWLLTAPWALNYSTHIVNPSYVLVGSILFFVGFFEVLPKLSINRLPLWLSFFFMGAATAWIFQLHLSWVILPILTIGAFVAAIGTKPGLWFLAFAGYAGGAILIGWTAIPTFIVYGLLGTGGTGANVAFNHKNIFSVFDILFRFFSFASFEVSRFIAASTKGRINFLMQNWWCIPAVIFGLVAGAAQVVWMIIFWFRQSSLPGWNTLKWFVVILIGLLYFSFLFSIKGPASHTLYLAFPVAMLYSFYCFDGLLQKKFWRGAAMVLIVCSLFFHGCLALYMLPKRSLYRDRPLVVKALSLNDYRILGERSKTATGVGY